MNKRFSTLMAVILMAGGLSANASQVLQIKEGRIEGGDATKLTTISELTEGNYYHLAISKDGAVGNVLSWERNYDDTKDSLIVINLSEDANGASARLKEFSADAAVLKKAHAMQVDSALWKITKDPGAAGIAGDGYLLVNKVSGKKLALDADVKHAYLSEEEEAIASWVWNGSQLQNTTEGKVYALATSKSTPGKVTFKTGDAPAAANELWPATPALVAMSARELNQIDGDGFKLFTEDGVSKTDNLVDRKFYAYQMATRTNAAPAADDLTEGVYLHAVEEEIEGQSFEDAEETVKNTNVFLVADTVSYTGSSIKFALDTIAQKSKLVKFGLEGNTVADTITFASGITNKLSSDEEDDAGYSKDDNDRANRGIIQTTWAFGRDSLAYQFYIFRNPGIEGDALTAMVGGVQTTKKKLEEGGFANAAGSDKHETEGDGAYISIVNKVLTVEPVKNTETVYSPAKLLLTSATQADLAEGLYYMMYYTAKTSSHAAKSNNFIVFDFKYRDAEGNLYKWTAATEDDIMMEGAVKYSDKESAISPLVPSTQWRLKKSLVGTTITNRENSNLTRSAILYNTSITDKGRQVYKFGEDSVKLIPVNNPAAEDKYVGYFHMDKDKLEKRDYPVTIAFNTPLGKAYVTKANDSILVANKNVDDSDKAVRFVLKAASADTKFDGGKAVRQAYFLKFRDADNGRVMGVPHGASKEANAKGKVKMTNYRELTGFNKFTPGLSDSIAVVFRQVAVGQYQMIMIPGVTGEGTAETDNAQAFRCDTLLQTAVEGDDAQYMYNDSVITLNNSDFSLITIQKDNALGYMTVDVKNPDEAVYAEVTSEPIHARIYASALTSSAITINKDDKGVLKSTSDLKSANYTEDNFKMFVDTASLADPELPMYFIHTTQTASLTEEELADNQSVYMTPNNDKNGVVFKKGKMYYGTKDTLVIMRAPSILNPTTNDSILVTKDLPQVFGFQTTNTKGEYYIVNLSTNKKLGYNNGVLTLGDSGQVFSLEEAETPTGNETIDTNAIKIVGGEGNVTVYGAAGKQVVVYNVLGQPVATVVAGSDSETIDAPQGVVAVSVGNAQGVKTIVK